MRRAALHLLLALAAAGCAPQPDPAEPALWEVAAPDGGRAWLFGTVHALERPAAWRGARIAAALDTSDLVLVEVADLDDRARLAATFARLASSEGHPPLSARVRPELRAKLRALLDKHDLRDKGFSRTETWAAALALARAESKEQKSEYGIDRAVLQAARGKRVAELEGAAGQLALFDALPEREQRDLLEAVVADAASLEGENPDLAAAWRRGDMTAIERETRRGLLADAELRHALFVGRNRAWTRRIDREMDAGRKPFVAVGAAHMAGPEGLPAMLAQEGYRVRRVQ